MTPRLDHVSVTVADLDRSIEFYRDVIGLPYLRRGEAAEPELSTLVALEGVRLRWAELDLGGGRVLELLRYVSPTGTPLDLRVNRPGATHIGLAVDDLDGIHRRLEEANATVSERPVVLTEPGEWRGVRTLYARDPDGVFIELVEPPDRLVRLPDVEVETTER